MGLVSAVCRHPAAQICNTPLVQACEPPLLCPACLDLWVLAVAHLRGVQALASALGRGCSASARRLGRFGRVLSAAAWSGGSSCPPGHVTSRPPATRVPWPPSLLGC